MESNFVPSSYRQNGFPHQPGGRGATGETPRPADACRVRVRARRSCACFGASIEPGDPACAHWSRRGQLRHRAQGSRRQRSGPANSAGRDLYRRDRRQLDVSQLPSTWGRDRVVRAVTAKLHDLGARDGTPDVDGHLPARSRHLQVRPASRHHARRFQRHGASSSSSSSAAASSSSSAATSTAATSTAATSPAAAPCRLQRAQGRRQAARNSSPSHHAGQMRGGTCAPRPLEAGDRPGPLAEAARRSEEGPRHPGEPRGQPRPPRLNQGEVGSSGAVPPAFALASL